jgi:D-alanyl-D-alanine carboxypeptidase/D-alanyl-D-alanine-endopeptidase (penicillin-binding protein 4)
MLKRLLITALIAALPAAHAALPEPVAAKLAESGIPADALSVLVIRGNAIVFEQHPERPMQPASTMKVVTTLAGLEKLGPVFRGRTELRTSAAVEGNTLRGDLVLRGGADPDLSTEALRRMLQTLRFSGIRHIEGKLVLDRTLFTPHRFDIGVPPFDEAPEAYYNVIPDALLVNKNMIELDLRADGKRLRVNALPALQRVKVTHAMTLVDGKCADWEDGWKPPVLKNNGSRIEVVLQGTFPRNCDRTYAINLIDRNDYVGRLVRSLWTELGGTLAGPVVEGRAGDDARLLAEHVSRHLPELVRDINKPSDNALARTLYLSMGALEADPLLGSRPQANLGADSTLVRADAAVRAWLRERGISDDGLVIENGSGLSRLERITAQQLAGILVAGQKSPWSPEFAASLPLAGLDGTLKRRLKGTAAEGRARLKTGTLRNVVALAGYVPDASGQQCVVVAIINDENTGNGKGRAVLDTIIDVVARSRAPAM